MTTNPALPDRYILSAGRTGTVFLERLLAQYAPDCVAEHEPTPTREQMMLANLRNDWGLGDGLLRRWFDGARARRRARAAGPYVEINPFLCAMTDLLPRAGHPLRIVHVTREPDSWARSMTVFKASAKFRWFIDYVPFAKPFPAPRPQGWARWSGYERNLARWVWCNQRICSLKGQAESYTHIRYEDLFAADQAVRQCAVDKVFDGLGLDRPAAIDWSLFATKANPAPVSTRRFAPKVSTEFLKPLARDLGYEA
jgi:hypothetical protein